MFLVKIVLAVVIVEVSFWLIDKYHEKHDKGEN